MSILNLKHHFSVNKPENFNFVRKIQNKIVLVLQNWDVLLEKDIESISNSHYKNIIENLWEKGINFILNSKNPNSFWEIITSKEFINTILQKDDKTILKYLFLITYIIEEQEQQLKEKLKTENIEIICNFNFISFFKLFQDEINDFKDIKQKLDLLKIYLKENCFYEKSYLTNFIEITREINNFKFTIKYTDLNKELLDFIKINFENISEYLDLSKINSFFDREINSYKDLENSLEKYFLTNQIDLEDLKKLFNKFNLEFKISNLYKLEKEYNEYYWNTKENYVKIEDILVSNENIIINIEFLENYTTQNFNIYQILNFLLLTKNYCLKNNWLFILNIEKLDSFFKTNNKEQLLHFNWKNFELLENFDKLYKNLNKFLPDLNLFLHTFKNLNLEKTIEFYNFLKENHKQIKRKINYEFYEEDNLKLKYIIWEYVNIDNFRNNEKVKAFLVRALIQFSLDTWNYSNLIENINNILKEHLYINEIINEELSKNKLLEVLKITNWFINPNIAEKLIIWNNFYKKEENEKFLWLKLENITEEFKKITQIKEEINPKDFQDNIFIWFLERVWYHIIWNDTWKEFDKFFKYFPDNNWKAWKIEDFKKWWFLEEIIWHLDISLELIEKKKFSLNNLKDFYSYSIDTIFFRKKITKIFKYKNLYYWYFKEAKNAILNPNYNFTVEIADNYPINHNNFTNYMWDNEIFLNYNQEWLKTNWIKPFSKAWFLKKPERKEYLKEENLDIIRNYWIVYSIYLFEWKEIWTNKEIEDISKILWFNISVKNYFYIKKVYDKLKDENINLKNLIAKIEWLNKKTFELIWWLLDEIWISYYYFLKDLNLLQATTSATLIIKILKHKIYPTNNIIKFINKWWTIEELITIKNTYKKQWWFDKTNILHIDLEYIDFRYLIDKATKKDHQVWKWYIEYRQLISWNYKEDVDEEKYYKQAWKESYFTQLFIEKILKNQERINIFPNFSYWKVLVAGIKEELINNPKINYKEVRIWSTECHWNLNYLKFDLFSKEDIKKLFQWDSIILDWTQNTSFWDSNIWFKNYFFVLNKVLSDILKDKSFIEWYNQDYISKITKTEEYKKLYLYLKWIIIRNKLYFNAKKFEFLYVWNYKEPYFRTRWEKPHSLKVLENDIINTNNTRKIYFTDFVERNTEFQAYFDDKHITDFKIIATKNWFNYVDTNFEEKIKKYTLQAKKEKITTDIIISK